jgi:penicillin-binding protein 2
MALNIAIGQGDLNVTPMQQLVLYGAIASGVLWKPQVVERIEDPSGKVVQQFQPAERTRLPVKKETRDQVMKGLLAAVNQPFGTGYGSRFTDILVDGKPVVMAGKTGTAQVVKLGAKRVKAAQLAYFERDHAWFAAFAPAEAPEIVVLVLNEHSGFGSQNAAPTAAAVVRQYFELKRADAMERAGVPFGPPLPPAMSPAPVQGQGREGPAAPPGSAPPVPGAPAVAGEGGRGGA